MSLVASQPAAARSARAPFAPVVALRTCVVLPAYNAARTLEPTLARVPPGAVDHFILVDDCSRDDTVEVARRLGLRVIRHDRNRGYGGNQKTCYRAALETDAEVVVMLHPDNQYDGALIPYMVGFIEAGVVDIVLGSRILRRKDVLAGGMPRVKYLANRLLTILENVVLGYNLPEYHTGYRAFHRRVLERVNFEACSDDFVFDQEILAQASVHDFRVGAVPVPTHYGSDSSSIALRRSSVYALATLTTLGRYLAYRLGARRQELFAPRAQIPDRENGS